MRKLLIGKRSANSLATYLSVVGSSDLSLVGQDRLQMGFRGFVHPESASIVELYLY